MKSKNNNFNTKDGSVIKMLTMKLNNNVKSKDKPIKNSYKSGRISSSDLENISIGLNLLSTYLRDGLKIMQDRMITEKSDITNIKLSLINFQGTINFFISSIQREVEIGRHIKNDIENLDVVPNILQAARDGIILKQEQKDGIKYDVPMTPEEVKRILLYYNNEKRKVKENKISNYIGLGYSIIGFLGVLYNQIKDDKKTDNNSTILITGATIISSVLSLSERFFEDAHIQEANLIERKELRLINELYKDEPISYKAREENIEDIIYYLNDSKKLRKIDRNRSNLIRMANNIAMAIVVGIYTNKQLGKNSIDNKIDAKLLSKVIFEIGNTKGLINSLIRVIYKMIDNYDLELEFNSLQKEVDNIMNQMGAKVYLLEGAKKTFNGFKITNLKGKFYPTTNYKTGEVSYNTKLDVPEFSIKRGETVLLSGESGTGKSTFLRLVKRGDINNRNCIELDNGEVVDSLGKEWTAFRPSTNLGDETSVLKQITGKERLKDLSEEDRNRFSKIMKDLRLYNKEIFSSLSTRKFMQFSTGQQRRLALVKVFYRIKDNSSVLIVDEPVRKC